MSDLRHTNNSHTERVITALAKAINDGGWTCVAHEPEPYGDCGTCEDAQRSLAEKVLDTLPDVHGWVWCEHAAAFRFLRSSGSCRVDQFRLNGSDNCPGPHVQLLFGREVTTAREASDV